MRPFRKPEACISGSTKVTYIVSYLEAPAPARAAWIDRKFRGDGILLDRENWRAARWTVDELRELRRSGKIPAWIPPTWMPAAEPEREMAEH